MRRPYRQAISLLLLVTFFVMGSGAYGFSSKSMAHELDHATVAASADHSHEASLVDGRDDNPDDARQPLSDSDHRLLHALGHCDPGPSSFFDQPRAFVARSATLLASLPVVLSADPVLSSRPPRSTSLI